MIPTPTAQLGRGVRRLPPVVLRERLAAARRAGMSFEEAWPGALDAAVNASRWEPAEWRQALSGTVEAWHAGLGAPARHKAGASTRHARDARRDAAARAGVRAVRRGDIAKAR
jgi:hypothetical protein